MVDLNDEMQNGFQKKIILKQIAKNLLIFRGFK